MQPSDILTKERIIASLESLNKRLTEKGVTGELCIFGGATMILAFDARESVASITDTESFGYCLRDFLDRFRDNPAFALIEEEPELLEPLLIDIGRADAFLASTAAYLAHKNQLPDPRWASGNSRALEKPWFAAKSHNLRMVLLQESPAAFRVRNLFVSANALSRA